MPTPATISAPATAEELALFMPFLRELADLAREILQPLFLASLDVITKSDESPVTRADRTAETALRDRIEERFPTHAIVGEEHGTREGRGYRWVLDPIDGTRAFMAGDPVWTVALALVEDGQPIAGVVHAPALGETFAASVGRGATLNGRPIRAASFASLAGARVAGPKPAVMAFAQRVGFEPELAPRMRSLAYRLVCVAAGRVEIALASAHSHDWDIAAADVILREAGAGLTENGREVSYNQPHTRHDPLLAAPVDWLQRLAGAWA